MVISERQLEENEAKIDNILHKVLKSMEHIKHLTMTLKNAPTYKSEEELKTFITDRTNKILLLSETVTNLTMLADEIDIEDETITVEIDTKIRGELDTAVQTIKEARSLLGQDD
ncbi:hypothetical protein HOD20_01065 [archaeon]|jgi:hypothetical protein|nr:hypothetical protein [archaeon]MBT4351093.1 hypothetical protein [archaeon]MBT4648099.1 hypothetical protein [archaeon]MBT6822537.1 hypothetical protein [archaeon]MBT7392538.1 hypothetical protein [archaeon]